MSALQHASRSERGAGPLLRLVQKRGTRIGRVPFLMIVSLVLGVGMVGLLLLNTHLQNQAFEANRLKRHAAALAYQEGELEQSVVVASSTRELTRRATALGLRPYHGIGYVNLADGAIQGNAAVNDDRWMPSALELSAEEVRANNVQEATNSAEHRRATERKAAEDARKRLLDARAKAEAEARAKAEADRRAAAPQPAPNQPAQPRPAQPQPAQPQPAQPQGAR